MEKRVVITGIGLLSCVGNSLPAFWDAIVNGKSGIDIIKSFDVTNFDVRIGGEVRDFSPEEHISRKDLRKMDRYLQFAVLAAKYAIDDSKLIIDDGNREDIGVCIGSGIGGMHTLEEQHSILLDKGPDKVSPFFIPMLISNMASGHVGIRHGIKGPNLSIVTACATAAHSIGESWHIIKRGDANAMIVGGSEATISKLAFAGFANMKATSTRNDEPAKASRPFDAKRNGFVMAEGAGVFVLEEYEHARARGAHIYAELVGFGMTADAHHITNPEPEGNGAARAIKMALRKAGVKPEEIGYINAHGTSTPAGDRGETMAIKSVFGDHARKVAISSSKSVMGHALGAAGALESVVCIQALRTGILPPTINYEFPDPDCDLDYVPNVAVKREISYAVNNSFGFGGQNSVLIYKKYDA
ncbi:MAG: beta-ketoacyl-ACP synthase II [Candidatus Eremiobacteraeota bacterium]|nr:beta-ketoacyl-ACP synthase II [Candidatus Eremiobacteraeota bacterium]